MLDHHAVQREGARGVPRRRRAVRQERDSRFASRTVSLGAAARPQRPRACCSRRGRRVRADGLYRGRRRPARRQPHRRSTTPRRTAPAASSTRASSTAQARGVFNGSIVVRPDAQKTDAQQTNKNLLLSDGAEVDTQAAARDLRRRREVHPRRGRRPARRGRALLSASRGIDEAAAPHPAHVRVRDRGARSHLAVRPIRSWCERPARPAACAAAASWRQAS